MMPKMTAHTVYRTFNTDQRREFVRITDDVAEAVDASGAVTSIPSPRETPITRAPSASSSFTVAAPMPRLAPVTTAVRPEMPRSMRA